MLRKAHMRSIPSVRIFPNVAFQKVQMFVLADDGSVSSFGGRSSSASSFHASLLQTIDGVTSLILCPHIMPQAPQHFRSSEMQATCNGCFAYQSVWSFPVTPAGPGQYTRSSFWRWISTIDTFQTRLSIPHFFFIFVAASSLNL